MSGRPSPRRTRTTSPASRPEPREPAPAQARAELSLYAAAVLAAGTVLALYVAVVRTYWGQRLDEHAFAGRAVVEGQASAGADDLLSLISTGTLILAVVVLALLALVQRRPAMAVLAFAVVAGSLLVTEVLKLEILTRPPLVSSVVLDNSYPSGHTTIGIAVGLAMLIVAPPRLRVPAAIAAAALAAAVGIATVAAGWHRPSDAVAAYFVALAVAAGAAALALRFLPNGAPVAAPIRDRTSSFSLTRFRPGPEELLVGSILVIGAGLFSLAVLRAKGIPWTAAGIGFLLSAAAIAACAALVVGALYFALAQIRPTGRDAQSPSSRI